MDKAALLRAFENQGRLTGHTFLHSSDCAFIDFESEAGAAAAKEALEGAMFNGHRIRIEFKEERRSGPPGAGRRHQAAPYEGTCTTLSYSFPLYPVEGREQRLLSWWAPCLQKMQGVAQAQLHHFCCMITCYGDIALDWMNRRPWSASEGGACQQSTQSTIQVKLLESAVWMACY